MQRRDFLKLAGRAAVTASGLMVVAALPETVKAAGHGGGCPMPFGPLHQFLYATAPDPDWQHAVIVRESGWDVGATNPNSGAAGLAQFLWSTWNWGSERFGIYGSPYDGYAAIRMMNAFISAGEYYHWSCGGQAGCYDV